MLAIFDPLREFTFLSMLFRLMLSLAASGLIGYGRTMRGCAAGIRTYMLISLGGTLSIMLTLYEYSMLHTAWAEVVAQVGEKFDASRLASQVITGIGFLGAGTILKVSHQQVNGLTTATGLFATVCMSIAAGAGFYECVILSMVLIVLVLNVLTPLETLYKRRRRNMTLTIEMESTDNLPDIRAAIAEQKAAIYELDIEKGPEPASVIIFLRLSRENRSHSAMLSSLAEMDCVQSVQELIT